MAWVPLPDMPSVRSHHAMAVMPNCNLVCAGGWDEAGNRLKTVAVFDLSISRWSSLPNMPAARGGHAMVAIATPDGPTLVCAGGDGDGNNYSKTVAVFTFSTNAWSSLPDMPSPRRDHGMVVLADSRIVCAGGFGNGGALKTVVVFNFTTNAWASLADMPSPRMCHGTVVLADGRLVCVGGRDAGRNPLTTAVVYDFGTNAWSPLPDMPSERSNHGTVAAADGRIVCAGGRDSGYNELTTAVVFDITTNAWSSLPDMPAPRAEHGMTMSLDGQIVCAGGEDEYGWSLSSTVVAFDFGPAAAAPRAPKPAAISDIAPPPFPSGLLSHTEEADAYERWADTVQAQVDAAGAAVETAKRQLEATCAARLDDENGKHQQAADAENRRHAEAQAGELRRHRDASASIDTGHTQAAAKLESELNRKLAGLPDVDRLRGQIQQARQKAAGFRQLHSLQGQSTSLLNASAPAAAGGGAGGGVSGRRNEKKRKVDEAARARETCVVCFEAPRNATIVHGDSGHGCCCFECATGIKERGGGCPICRQSIDMVIKQFN